MKLETCLAGTPLFMGIAAKERAALLDCLMLECVSYPKHTIVVSAGGAQSSIGVVTRGEAHMLSRSWDGQEKFAGLLLPGDCFGLETAFPPLSQPLSHWSVSVVAAQRSQVVFLDTESLFTSCSKHCAHHQTLRDNLVRTASQSLRTLQKRVELLTIKSMRGRIIGYLLQRIEEEGEGTLSLPFNRNRLASYLDVSRPSMSRERARMKDEGLLDYYLDTISVGDVEKLRDSAQRDESAVS